MRYNGIQCLRALAALLVMWAHLRSAGDFSGLSWIETAAGAVGVDIFFVISGFVISISAENLRYNTKDFIINRLSRVIPVYWFFSIPYLLLQILQNDINWNQIINTVIFIPFFDESSFTNPLHRYGWTLNFEIYFYILFATVIAIRNEKSAVSTIVLLFLGCISTYIFYNHLPYFVKFMFHPFVLEFASGILIYKTLIKIKQIPVWLPLTLSLIFSYLVIETEALGFHNAVLDSHTLGFNRFVIWGGLGISLVLLFISLDLKFSPNWPSWLLTLGNSSFSLYLIQPYSLKVSSELAKTGFSNWLCGALYIFLTIFLGVLISKLLENRLTTLSKQIINHCLMKANRLRSNIKAYI